jgi:hypothetical protein
MTSRTASCRCGAVRVECAGEPVRVSVCHCLNCQLRSGSAFAAQARWPAEAVTVTGETREWTPAGNSGGRAVFRFCPICGATVAYVAEQLPDVIAVPLGAFADPGFTPGPEYSVYEARKHRWVEIVGEVEHFR